MGKQEESIDQLLQKLDDLERRQELFSREVSNLRGEISRLRKAQVNEILTKPVVEPASQKEASQTSSSILPPEKKLSAEPEVRAYPGGYRRPMAEPAVMKTKPGISWEKFIGENLINKIGILILVIGIAIGVKYSIDHDLISPTTRIILGYLTGVALLVTGIRLKPNFENYSAVLVSGAMAVLYFITYAACAFYNLYTREVAFGLMVIITAATVIASLKYDNIVIALIGQVGAYAVPFLLGDEKGNASVLFGYMLIINVGILIISLKKYWVYLYMSAFLVTWLIFCSWCINSCDANKQFGVAFTFLTGFFVEFYITFLAFKVQNKQLFGRQDIMFLLANSFIFFGVGYGLVTVSLEYNQLGGWFTLLNGVIHLGVLMLMIKKEVSDKNLVSLVLGLVLIFATIIVPVQLDGNWVTFCWAGEALLLFWIGRKRESAVYELLSYPVIVLTFFSLIQDWTVGYAQEQWVETGFRLFLNVTFLETLLVAGSFGSIIWIDRSSGPQTEQTQGYLLVKLKNYYIPFLMLFILFFGVQKEIAAYWYQQATVALAPFDVTWSDSFLVKNDYRLYQLKELWHINYGVLFFTLLSYVNILKLKETILAYFNMAFNLIAILFFLFRGLYLLGVLRDGDFPVVTAGAATPVFHVWVRYVSLLIFAGIIWAMRDYTRQKFHKTDFREYFDYLLYGSLLWVLTSELINWMVLSGVEEPYKLGTSIFWGVYSLFLIAFGIWRKKKHLRIGAIALFGVTLLKLFFYDLSGLDTISKTILFVSLGILLLIISFIYNKYRHLIAD